MKYLENYGFNSSQIDEVLNCIPMSVATALDSQKKLVGKNVQFLKELGLDNVFDVFFNYYDMFLMDNSLFEEVFNKYDREDLVEKITQNIAIIEYL